MDKAAASAGDAALVERCRRGDRQALEALINRYERPVYNAALRMLGDRDGAKDVTQTVFLKVIEHLDSYNPNHRMFSWIYRIAINESINQLKRDGRAEHLEGEGTSPERGPGDIADSDDLGEHVQQALMRLKPEHRTVLVLRHFAECSYRDIGLILEIPEKTVKSRLFTARQQLRDTLEADGVHRGR